MTTAAIKRHGGKTYLADWIISHMPQHIHYVEPYFGGGAVLLKKPHKGISEVVNDIDYQLTTFWQVLASPTLFPELVKALHLTPFSESEWKDSDIYFLNPVNVARSFFIRCRQSRQGLGEEFATLTRNRTRRGMNEQVSAWLSSIEGLEEVHERIKRVVIYNRDALDVIEEQDGRNTLFYCDPTYLHETRTAKNSYKHEMNDEQHELLLKTLSRICGRFILSGYPSKMYDEFAKKYRWKCKTKLIDNKAASGETKRTMTECIWMNF